MEYRIVEHPSGQFGIHKVVRNNGSVEYSREAELMADNLRELTEKIIKANEAFWKPVVKGT